MLHKHDALYVLFHSQEELEKHIVWLSNKKYIEEHNANADKFGFKLAMNQFGDVVRSTIDRFLGRFKLKSTSLSPEYYASFYRVGFLTILNT